MNDLVNNYLEDIDIFSSAPSLLLNGKTKISSRYS